jgi:hypothetical protein
MLNYKYGNTAILRAEVISDKFNVVETNTNVNCAQNGSLIVASPYV